MTVDEILRKEGKNEDAILREHLLFRGLAKFSRYEAECALFAKKYGRSLEALRELVGQRRQQEIFNEEDDLMDWEFADAALKWWQSQLEDLRRAA